MSNEDNNRRTSILKPGEESNDLASRTKRRVSFHTHRTVKEFDKAELGVDRTPKNESIHFSGSSEERSSFFGNRPGSALTYTSHQTSEVVINDLNNITMNSTANATIAMFNRVQKSKSFDQVDCDTTSVFEPTIALLDHLVPSGVSMNQFSTPVRDNANNKNQDDQTLAFIEKLLPGMLTPEVRASPKRLAELVEDLSRPVKHTSPTSDKNPYEIDNDVTKAFSGCTLSPVKPHEAKQIPPPNFDEHVDEKEAISEIENRDTTPKKSSAHLPIFGTPKPLNSTYTVPVAHAFGGGYYVDDDSETVQCSNILASHGSLENLENKTYVVSPANKNAEYDDQKSHTESVTSSSSRVSFQPSEKTKKNLRRLSDIINREKRRSSVFNASSSAANSPAIEEEKIEDISVNGKNTSGSSSIIAHSTVKESNECSVDICDEKMDQSEVHSMEKEVIADSFKEKIGDSVIESFEQMSQRPESVANNGTVLLEDVNTPSRYLEDTTFTMPPKPMDIDADAASITVEKSVNNFSVINQTFEAEPTEPSNFSFGLSGVDKKRLKSEEEQPKINQTPGWAKYSKCLEIMQKMSDKEEQEQAISMETFDEEPNYLNADSVIMDPTTPRKILSSMSYQREYRDRNLEEPTYPESLLEDKENHSGIMNSTYCKSSTNLEHKTFQMSRLGCVERRFAPDKAFFIEKLIKEVNELKCLVQNLKIELLGIENVVPEYLIYDEKLVIEYYQLIVKISKLDNEFMSFNGYKGTMEKQEDLSMVEEKLEQVQKAIDQVEDELKLTSFT